MTAREILAPDGRLRVGAFPGSPVSMAKDSGSGEIHGLAIDLGNCLALKNIGGLLEVRMSVRR